MSKVLQATYHDGNLVLDEKLDAALEGKKLTLILVEEEFSSQSELEQKERTRKFLEWAQKYSAKLPPDYRFDREEAHER
jgi:predicted DNA-binding antitoxin AbrB/MazE fold protein